MSEELKTKIEEFKTKKINWIQLAPYILELKNFENVDPEIDRRDLLSIVKAYRFLKTQRADFLNKDFSKDYLPHHNSISYLPFIIGKFRTANRMPEVEKIIDEVLNGKIKKTGLVDLSNSFGGAKEEIEPLLTVDSDKVALEKMFEVLNFALEKIKLTEEDRNELAAKAHYLAMKLQCLADKEFEQSWNNRRKFTVEGV
jgi:hypothetical protein